jgi:hypothetical protein
MMDIRSHTDNICIALIRRLAARMLHVDAIAQVSRFGPWLSHDGRVIEKGKHDLPGHR